MMSFLSRRALAGLTVVVLLGLLIPTFAAPADDDKPKAELPADLALVPHDALWFATFRVGDLARNKDVKSLLPLLPSDRRQTVVQEFEKDFGLKTAAIERFTVFVRRTRSEPIWIVRMAKGFDKHAFLKHLGGTDEVKVHGKAIHLSKPPSRIGPFTMWFPDDRAIVVGPREGIVHYLAALSRPAKTHPLADELKVASGKHAVVVGLLPSLIFRSIDAESHVMRGRWEKKARPDFKDRVKEPAPASEKGLPPPKCGDPDDAPPPPPKSRSPKERPAFDPERFKEEPLKLRSIDEIVDTSNDRETQVILPLFRARRALLSIDLGDEIQVKARADFDSVDQAKDAGVVTRMGQYLLREMFPALLAKQMRLDMKAKGLATLFAQFKTAVRAGEVKRDGKTVEVALSAKIDPAPLFAYMKDVAPIREDANNLKQIGIAFHNYEGTHAHLPQAAICDTAGKPLLSWRVAILPYIEQDYLYRQFKLDEAWDSPHNKKLIGKMPKIYAAPAGKAEEPDVTFYQLLTGPNTLYPQPNTRPSLARISDGTSNTLLAVEAGKAVPWTKPADIVVPAKGDLPKLGGQFGKFFNALWCDGSVRQIKRDFDQETMRNAIDPADGNILRERKLEP